MWGVDDGKKIKTNVGSGLTDDNRDKFWQSKDKLIGQIVEVRADAVTKNQDSDNEYSLRFPRLWDSEDLIQEKNYKA